MELLVTVVVLMFAAVLLVALGDRLGLPWPVLMVVLTAAAAFVPGLAAVHVDPQLILPLLLPPLLWAVARRTSWAVFRSRWRAITRLAVLLVLATTAAVAGTAHLLSPDVTVAAAVTLGAAVAPPDPVAVEAVTRSVAVPQRVLRVLQVEGLFNDAVSLVVFQLAVSAATGGAGVGLPGVLGRFAYAVVVAAAIGSAAAWLAGQVLRRVPDVAASAGLTLVIPFAVYLGADAAGASGVVAVVVAALQLGRAPQEQAAERLVGTAFWRVLELLLTGVAFGLIGLQLRAVAAAAGDRLGTVVLHGLVVAGVVVALRMAWMLLATVPTRWRDEPDGAPRTAREALVMAWSGMRGLVTLALALSLPDRGFPARTEVVVVAVVVLLVTLLGQGLTLPWVVRAAGVASGAEVENAAETALARRAGAAALAAVTAEDRRDPVPDDLREQLLTLYAGLPGAVAAEGGEGAEGGEDRAAGVRELRARREAFGRFRTVALDAARREVLRARGERGVDPEAADRILQRLDERTLTLDG